MTYDEVLAETRQSMDKALTHLGDVLRGIRTSRASTALVDHVRVEYYGTPTPISQLAAVSIPEPRQLMIKPFDANSLKDVEKALLKSDLGITPQNDGKVIRLTMPPLSSEQRKKYAAKVKDMVEDARIAMRNGRREFNKQADALHKEGGLTEDQNHKLHDEIQTVLKDYEKRLDGILEKKTAEVMEV